MTLKLSRKLHQLESSQLSQEAEVKNIREELASSRHDFRKEMRGNLAQTRDTNDMKLYEILSDPSSVYKSLRRSFRRSSPTVHKMKVGQKVYEGAEVPDGMFDSLNSLKAPSMVDISTLPPYVEAVETYKHVIQLAAGGGKIPALSLAAGEKLLRKMRPSVIDFYSITSLHFLNLGHVGTIHFVFLLNSIIDLINSSSMAEMNTIWANILHKGHGKDAEVDRSWRTISCCPFLAKAIDIYFVELNNDSWSASQA